MKNRVALSHGRYARRPQQHVPDTSQIRMASSLMLPGGAVLSQQRRVEFLLGQQVSHRHLHPLANNTSNFRNRMREWNVVDHVIFIIVLAMLLTVFVVIFFVPVRAADVTAVPLAAYHYFVDPLKMFLSAF
ncbi:hypothetical protein [Herbaspirillum autotrophicum]|uniref:hypothetical protein n=1 Tax=Herbaspirillum autotrophicum TaxID=180195 RepID=UPI000A8F6B44|nr:hypothetical protein [Herbaspirillum autotrophicum]